MFITWNGLAIYEWFLGDYRDDITYFWVVCGFCEYDYFTAYKDINGSHIPMIPDQHYCLATQIVM